MTLDSLRDLVAVDFRFGVPITYRQGPWETKFGYYHLSSHIGDEYLEKNPGYSRINYVRESLVLGLGWRPNPDWRLYSEAGYAVYKSGGAEPWLIYCPSNSVHQVNGAVTPVRLRRLVRARPFTRNGSTF